MHLGIFSGTSIPHICNNHRMEKYTCYLRQINHNIQEVHRLQIYIKMNNYKSNKHSKVYQWPEPKIAPDEEKFQPHEVQDLQKNLLKLDREKKKFKIPLKELDRDLINSLKNSYKIRRWHANKNRSLLLLYLNLLSTFREYPQIFEYKYKFIHIWKKIISFTDREMKNLAHWQELWHY